MTFDDVVECAIRELGYAMDLFWGLVTSVEGWAVIGIMATLWFAAYDAGLIQ